METGRSCGCKGIRTCLLCEEKYNIRSCNNLDKTNGTYTFCPFCKKCFADWNTQNFHIHSEHDDNFIEFPGIYIKLNFLTIEEEKKLLEGIDTIPWQLSQSGRRKQNFGPKCNFNKRKIQPGNFIGFPAFSKFVQEKFSSVKILQDFQTIEQCSLEYDPTRGASIDPHIDDCWVWGERIVTVNLLADSILSMTYNQKPSKYNLNLVSTYPSILDETGSLRHDKKEFVVQYNTKPWPIVRIPLPRRSLFVMYGKARYEWEHQILREDIVEKRICLAYREFTPSFLEGGDNYKYGKPILDIAQKFF